MAKTRRADRLIIHCPVCKQPQRYISTHLARRCMAGESEEARREKVTAARASQKTWSEKGRVWDFAEIRQWCPEPAGRYGLLRRLLDADFIVVNMPEEDELQALQASAEAARPLPCAGEQVQPEAAGEEAASLKKRGKRSQPKLAIGPNTTLGDCQRVLQRAQQEMTDVVKSIQGGRHVTDIETTRYRYYCEAVLILKLLLSPSTVENLTAKEWLERRPSDDGHVIVTHTPSDEGKPATSFALTEDDAVLLQVYFQKIRPGALISRDLPDNRFFIGRTGSGIKSASMDVLRLHRHYRLPPVSGEDVRLIAARDVADLPEGAAPVLRSYLGFHDGSVVLPLSPHQLSLVCSYLVTLRGSADAAKRPDGEPGEAMDLGAFYATFPVTLYGEPPSKKQRVDAGFPGSRKLFDKWRAAQLKLRRRHLMTKWSRQKPTLTQVQRYVSRSKWSKNCVPAGDFVRLWAPPPPTGQEETDVARYVGDQSWTGLVIAESQRPGAGRGVFATRNFGKGSVVCDYHGRLITASEGREILATLKEDEGSYLFFFKSGNQSLCVDAQPEHCHCHPEISTFGRLINHSAKRNNSKCVVANLPGLGQAVLLIEAVRDIVAGEEVLMDYGVRRRSFGGEGMDLLWLNE